ncbi:MAG: hypothetical protein IJQ85_03165 [Selenomonadaceae bacterium]|nr:hypothetical protein [Selenomonadaceae bacterium]
MPILQNQFHIANICSDYCTINSGDGDDTVDNFGYEFIVNTGTGDDSVYSRASSDSTINTGAGDDYIYNYGGDNLTVKYSAGDGNDIIYGFDSKDTLTLDGITFKTSMATTNPKTRLY